MPISHAKLFGEKALFLEIHDLDIIIRAHQVVEEGFELFGSNRLVTIFSAPNYSGGNAQNIGCVILVKEDLEIIFKLFKPGRKIG
uniref:SER_THR_PHOSPHATASE domain-containing protein n=1 Tax=Rhabditophanes sp. KR3021 TaxID=114890 RepID=A0AC35U1T3_9BILA